jgi:amino acid transporter/mannitol/fructose-specific phosphotransferase system IIA component (Ntr-type)
MADLKKSMGLGTVFCLASGAMISSGLFVLPGLAHAQAGPAVVFSYFFAGCLAATGMLSLAKIITAMPKAGGDYFYITRTLGPAAGAVSGLLTWFSLTLKSAFALVGIMAFMPAGLPIDSLAIGVILGIIFIVLNLTGAKKAGLLQIILVTFLLGLLLAYALMGSNQVHPQYFQPFLPQGWPAVFSTAGMVFVAYGGLLNIASVAEEVENPGRNIPLGMFLSLMVITLTYTVVVFITTGVLPAQVLDHSLTPISDGAKALFGDWGYWTIGGAAMLAFISTANAGLLSASRYLLALSRDQLVPQLFGKLTPRGAPINAILLTGAFMIAALFLKLDALVQAASTVMLLTYFLANACLIVLRESGLLNYRPSFRAPGYPWVQILGMAGFGLLILEMGYQAILISLALVAGGLLFYWFYGRVKAARESALQHLLERVTSQQMVKGELENELRDILKERDQLCQDTFDRLARQGIIMDIKEAKSQEALFMLLGKELAQKGILDLEKTRGLLADREKKGSTVLLQGVAMSDIPHPDPDGVAFLAARLDPGVLLQTGQEPVRAFFLLVVGENKTNEYLQALAALAQVTHHLDFMPNWLAGRDSERLRDVLLLGPRRRLCEV